MIGTVLAWGTFVGGAASIAALTVRQAAAHRKGAVLGPHRRRGRVPCATCDRFVWTDHAWFAGNPAAPYCSIRCIPNP